jgi:hypothetical protein
MAKQMPDPTTASKRWSTAMAGSGQKMTDGVNAVTVAPGQAAAAQADLWAANVANSKPRFKANVAAVPLSEWQQSMISKGVARVGAGAQAAEPKYAAAASKWYPIIASARAQLPPRGNIQQNIQRSSAMAMALNAAKNR